MAFPLIVALFSLLLTRCHCFNPKLFNVSMFHQSYGSNWRPAGATWYGSPNGGGSDGGACGYINAVDQPPFSGMISSAGPSIYQSGEGCGVCYQVKCTNNAACSGKAVTVTITDSCPGCTSESAHFDLSGTSFGAMAKPGFAQQLRNAGLLLIQYRRVNCNYPGVTVVVRVDPGSNSYYFAATIEYADGTGIGSVELRQQSGGWMPMEQSWGAIWKLDEGCELHPPFSLRLTEAESDNSIVLTNVIPLGWQPARAYRSHVNFDNY